MKFLVEDCHKLRLAILTCLVNVDQGVGIRLIHDFATGYLRSSGVKPTRAQVTAQCTIFVRMGLLDCDRRNRFYII